MTGLANFFDNIGTFRKGGDVYHRGDRTIGEGFAISDRAIADIGTDVAGYQDLIGRGGLTKPLVASFDRARANVVDRGTAARLGARSSLAQRQLESGGNLSDAALAEMELGASNETDQQVFEGVGAVDAQQAELGFAATNSLMDRIAEARRAVLGAGEFRASIGNQQLLSALDAMLQRRKAIASTAVSMTGAATGGGGFGGK